MDNKRVISWLLKGDTAIQYQVHRDLLGNQKPDLQERISSEGWGAQFLRRQKTDGHWGQRFYQPKWISTHYTLLDLKHLCISPDHPRIRDSIRLVLETLKAPDGGILPIGTARKSDICVDGMFLNYASYFRTPEDPLQSIIDLIAASQLADGGFNCRLNRNGAVHSSMHSTISVLEGLWEYLVNGYACRSGEVKRMLVEAREFLLQHELFRSDHTGRIINKRFLMLSFPSRWQYDILRALVHFQTCGQSCDTRLQPALDVLLNKRRKDGTWPVQAKHPGKTHFDMEKTGGPSRWNTLRALRVLRHFEWEDVSY